MVPTTRNLLELVIGIFAGIMANDLTEGAGQGIQVVTSIADIAHHIVGLGEGEPPDSCPEECRTLGNRSWGQVVHDLACAWEMKYDMDDPSTAFRLLRQAPWLAAKILQGNQAFSAPGVQGQICIHVLQSPTSFQLNDKQSLVGTSRWRRYQVTIGTSKEP